MATMRLALGLLAAVAPAPISATTCLESGHVPGGNLKLPFQRKNVVTEEGQEMPLGVVHGWWTSSKLLSHIFKIIAEEAVGYNVTIAASTLGNSGQSVYAIGGCEDFGSDCWQSLKAQDPDGKILSRNHFAFEIWENYFRQQMDVWTSNYPEKAPEEIGTVGYYGDEGVFINPISNNAGLRQDKLILDWYRGYNTSEFSAEALSRHFTKLSDLGRLLPNFTNHSSYFFTCDELRLTEMPYRVNPILRDYHVQFPNDTTVSYNESTQTGEWQCDYEGIWWLSPACREDPDTCIPIITMEFWGNAILHQASYFHMPIALASIRSYGDWTSIIASQIPLTYWWYPDDLFIKSDLKIIAFPPYNKEQYEIQGLQVSQLQAIPLRKLMARGFGSVAGDAALVAKELWVPESNIIAMMKSTTDGATVEDMACDWVRANTELWHQWLPGQLVCNPGQGLVNKDGEFLSSSLNADSCGWCEPGTYSAFWNGTEQTICSSCPAGSFQKSPGQTACEPCSSGKFTDSQGNTACTDCAVATYAEGSGNTNCTSCLAHESTMVRAAETSWDCVCDAGYYRAAGHSESSGARTDCKACPAGMECEKGNDAPMVSAGFWVSEQNGIDREYSVYRCQNDLECPGGEAGTCAAGRDPSVIGCASCRPAYHRASKGECTKCEGSAWLPLLGASFLVVCGLSAVAFFARVDVTKIRMNTVSVAICMSQTVMIVQTMSLFFTMKIDWVEPMRSMLSTFSIAAFNYSALNLSCGVSDSDSVAKYVLQLLSFPLGLSLLCAIFAIMHFALGKPISKDHVINSVGVLTLVLFLMLNMTALKPFHCVSSPNGTSSLSSNPSIICYVDSEWVAMAVMGTIAVLVYGVGFFSIVLYITISYPALALSARGSIIMSRYRFMFQRFTAKCFYFTPIYLMRTLFIALIPVIFADYGHRQMIFLVLTMVVFGKIHATYQPWRGAIPNMLDVWVMGCMILLLTCSSLLIKVDGDEMVADLEVFFTIIMVFVFGAVGIFLAFLAYRRFVPKDRWTAFLCHIPDTAMTARWVKIDMQKRIGDKKGIFLAADNLDWNLEDIFDLMRCQLADNVVVLLSGGTLSSPQCAGQVTTAHTNGVRLVPVALDSYTELCDADLDEAAIATRWSAEAFRRCTAEGISLAMVKDAYSYLRGASKISCRVVANRLASSHGASLQAIAMVSSTCGAGKAADGPEDDDGEYDVGVVADVCDSEAIAAAEVLKSMVGAIKGWKLKGLMQDSEVRQARAPSQLLVVVLTRGCLGSESFVQTAAAALQAWPSAPMLAARAEDFSFPTVDTMQKVLTPQIARGAEIPEAHVSSSYAALLASPSVSFVANARMSSLEKQVGYLVECAAEVVTGVRGPSITSCAEEVVKDVEVAPPVEPPESNGPENTAVSNV
ncbi:unnamed protein product [Prorocentrum cordatum]|uniref:Tyrosine-protein kinase ephrin type A/B receptor-like domain-containing protein n=1 Tax=Prorocentrum cordatum TaxID=2364126 RepID=A0ABN9UL42_9DINO|nr:unnamed protein product [Polarella glacialis]